MLPAIVRRNKNPFLLYSWAKLTVLGVFPDIIMQSKTKISHVPEIGLGLRSTHAYGQLTRALVVPLCTSHSLVIIADTSKLIWELDRNKSVWSHWQAFILYRIEKQHFFAVLKLKIEHGTYKMTSTKWLPAGNLWRRTRDEARSRYLSASSSIYIYIWEPKLHGSSIPYAHSSRFSTSIQCAFQILLYPPRWYHESLNFDLGVWIIRSKHDNQVKCSKQLIYNAVEIRDKVMNQRPIDKVSSTIIN